MIIDGLLRSFEDPATPLADPDNWLVDLLGGGRAHSGVVVNAETVLEYPAVYRATMLISGDVGKIPLFVYRRLADGRTKERATTHPAYRLLRWKANDAMNALEFKQLLETQALLLGNGYAFIERAATGAPGALLPLNANTTRPIRVNGKLWYLTALDSGENARIPGRDIFHIKGLPGLAANGLAGVSVIGKGRESFGLGMAATQYGARFFGNNLSPGAVLETPTKLSTKAHENLRESFEKAHLGLGRSHRLMILEQGLKINPYTIAPDAAQFLETRIFEVRDVANWFGLPPHKLGDPTRTSFKSLEQENQSYLDDALDLWFSKWEHEARDKLLTNRQKAGDTHIVEFLRAALVRADLAGRTEANVKAVTTGWKSRDEVRAEENMGPLPDGEGAKFLLPSSVRVVGENAGLSGSGGGPTNVGPQDQGAVVADEGDQPGDQEGPADGSDNDDGGEGGSSRQAGEGRPARAGGLPACGGAMSQAVQRVSRRIGLSTRRVRGASDPNAWREHLAGLAEKHRDQALRDLAPVWAVCEAQAPEASQVVDSIIVALGARLAQCRTSGEVDLAVAELAETLPERLLRPHHTAPPSADGAGADAV